MNRRWLATACLGGTLLGGGCAHRGPVPNELAEARAIYSRASAGPARRLAAARLAQAKDALAAAELAHLHGSPAEAEDRAYVAARRSELAEAEASTTVAAQRRAEALRELASLSGPHANRARAELASAAPKPSTPPLATSAPADLGAASATPGPSVMQLQPARQIQGARIPTIDLPPASGTTTPSPAAVSSPAAPAALQPARATETQPVSTPPPVPRDNSGALSPDVLVPPPVSFSTPVEKPSVSPPQR